MGRIHWKEDEAIKMVKKMKQLHRDYPDWNKFELLDAAQGILPEDRQRALIGWVDRGPAIDRACETLGIDFSNLAGGKRRIRQTVVQEQPHEEPVVAVEEPRQKRKYTKRQTQLELAMEKAKANVVEEPPPAPTPAPQPKGKPEPQVEYKAAPPAPAFDEKEVERTAARMLQSFGEAAAMPVMDAFFQLARSVAVQFGTEVAREVAVMVGKQATLAAREAIRTEMAGLSEKVTKAMERPYDTLSQPVPPKTVEELAVQREPVKQVILQAASPVPEDVGAVKMAPKDRKPRVAIIGLMRQQESEVMREFGDDMEFTWVRGAHNGGSGEVTPEKIKDCDVVLGMRWISGENVSACKKAGVPFAKIHGSFGTLKRWLQQWFNGEIVISTRSDEQQHRAA